MFAVLGCGTFERAPTGSDAAPAPARADGSGGGATAMQAGNSGTGGAGATGGGSGGFGAGGGGDAGAVTPDVPVGSTGGAPGTEDASPPAPCIVSSTRCSAAADAVEVCGANGEWSQREPCPAICRAGACAGTCKAGEKHCGREQTPETCSADGEWVAAAACQFACIGRGECGGTCVPGSKRCGGEGAKVPEVCDPTGVWVAAGQPCAAICSSGSCSGSCSPGTKRCGPNQVPETCDMQGTWQPGPRCEFICSSGSCAGECSPGAKRCDGRAVQTCGANGRWTTTMNCPTSRCDGDRYVGPASCDVTTGRCNVPETVSCGAGLLCEGGACVPGCRDGRDPNAPTAPGAPSTSSSCPAGLFCDAEVPGGRGTKCLRPQQPGGPCKIKNGCTGEVTCNGGKCCFRTSAPSCKPPGALCTFVPTDPGRCSAGGCQCASGDCRMMARRAVCDDGSPCPCASGTCEERLTGICTDAFGGTP